MSSNRHTKEELRHDAFVDTTARVTHYLQNNFMAVMVGVAAIAVVVVGVVFLQQSREGSRVQASQLMFRATSLYQNGQYSDGLIVMDDLISQHGGSREGRSALYLAGASHLALGENDEAVARFEEYLGAASNGEYATSARLGIALASEGRGDLEAAATTYREVREQLDEQSPFYVQAAIGEARALQALGRIDEAVAILRPMRDVEDFNARQEIDNRIATLEALR